MPALKVTRKCWCSPAVWSSAANSFEQARDQALRVVDRQLIEQDAELLAAVAPDDVGAAQVLPQRGGQRRQHAVARLMPVGVVDSA